MVPAWNRIRHIFAVTIRKMKSGIIRKRSRLQTMTVAIDIVTDTFPKERADFGELAAWDCAITIHTMHMYPASRPGNRR